MADPLFAGFDIFGTQCRQGGPFYAYRTQRHTLPGVWGQRIFDLGADVVVWTVEGTLWDISLAAVNAKVAVGQGYMEAVLGTFRDNGGNNWSNCLVTDFRPNGNYTFDRRVGVDGYSVRIAATIEQIGL